MYASFSTGAPKYMMHLIGVQSYGIVHTIGYELIQHRFHEMLERLRAVNRLGVMYLDRILKEQWMRSYDGGLRYEHVTINLAEYINFVLKGPHHFLITSMVKETYFQLATKFLKQAETYAGQALWIFRTRETHRGYAVTVTCPHLSGSSW
ncbi:hypothetical protein PVK06_029880 [Gossypium arboreum]|uniref:Uncharacterized protein n=1 Tax=Gossypium arboreum TaxID=29729 RepID=A0ABR0NLU1_GOSAR|nr:hypothetical protein PVK06_029880 [Gossypium arboreum]